jgi:drug/metabolite transporter (DMT)-like permease
MMENQRGILAILTGSTAFVAHDAAVKLLSAELPSSEIVILRGLVATAMMVIGVFVLRAGRPLSILFQPLMLLRVLAAAGATVFIILALRNLPLATATTVLQATPLVVTAGAALLYGDVVGLRRWMAVLAGFLGVVLIVKPGVDFGGAAYLILLGLLCTTTCRRTSRRFSWPLPAPQQPCFRVLQYCPSIPPGLRQHPGRGPC